MSNQGYRQNCLHHTYRAVYEWGKGILAEAAVEEAELDARLLLEHVCGTSRNDLLVHGDREIEEKSISCYEELIGKRAMRIPLQHLTGIQEFMGLTFEVSEDVLIPRQDTEILVEEVMRRMHDGMRILDLCTGSGCILISLLHYSNECSGVGADISGQALAIARRNARELLSPEKEIAFIQSDLFEKVEGQFDVIVSNPPYIRSDVIATLQPEVRDHEPVLALDGAEDGLYFYRRIITQSRDYLKKGGFLLFEIGCDQGSQVSELMRSAGFAEVEIFKDYAGLDRVVSGSL